MSFGGRCVIGILRIRWVQRITQVKMAQMTGINKIYGYGRKER